MKSPGVAYLLAFLLALPPLGAQSPAVPPPAETLKVLVLNGEGALNNIRQRAARDLELQVNDEKGTPVADASVSLALPSQGATGTFANGSSMVTAMTDTRGQAVIKGFRPNDVPGKLQIAVTASYRGRTGHAVITQFNMAVEKASQKSGHGKLVIILAVVGVAAAAGAYAALGRSSSPPPAPPAVPAIVITPGAGTVGAPGN
jgi:hypothetical protein